MSKNPSARLWLAEMIATLKEDEFARIAVTLRGICYARRKIIHDEVFQRPLSTHLLIESYLQSLTIAKPTLKLGGGAKPAHPRWMSKG
jgi:hypothetical protein